MSDLCYLRNISIAVKMLAMHEETDPGFPRCGCDSLLFGNIFAENCMKMRKKESATGTNILCQSCLLQCLVIEHISRKKCEEDTGVECIPPTCPDLTCFNSCSQMSAVADPGFPPGGDVNPPRRGHEHTILPNSPKNCMILKEIGRPIWRAPPPPPIRQWSVLVGKRGRVSIGPCIVRSHVWGKHRVGAPQQ